MDRPLEVVIVGGGTAGWMTAAGLVGVLTAGQVRVRLVESEEIGTVGVGEATLPQMRAFNDRIGIVETEMMRRTQATFKLGIEFVDWGFHGSRYVHPFGAHGRPIGGVGFIHQWARAHAAGEGGDIGRYAYAIEAARAHRFDYPVEDRTAVNSTYDYAYHFDASLYARYLRGWAEARGLERIEGKVVDVARREDGGVASVRLERGETIAADLFVDCSGFRALLIGQALDGPWEDWSRWLPCDRALAAPTSRSEDFTPFTRSTAEAAGWRWRIPLQHRTGNGLVYSSEFEDDEQALRRLLRGLEGEPLAEPRPIRYRSGRRTRSWDRNVVAIGLASGFLEPLESTSLYLSQVAVEQLLRLLPGEVVDPRLAAEFNRVVDNEYDRVRDFLILHYHLNQRDEPMWRACREMTLPDSLAEKLSLFRRRGHIVQYQHGLFSPPSWISVLVGQGMAPEGWHPLAERTPMQTVTGELAAIRDQIAARVAKMPTHADFVADHVPAREPAA